MTHSTNNNTMNTNALSCRAAEASMDRFEIPSAIPLTSLQLAFVSRQTPPSAAVDNGRGFVHQPRGLDSIHAILNEAMAMLDDDDDLCWEGQGSAVQNTSSSLPHSFSHR
ncbi:expressed unknown protein [Seminavis robusta]|uniref:Uncharacterized protein n=1 Tax=Seminavis robusta TaxID=568900 RepID=A0A9N8HLE2_9STRA|nr:expressed unknown protein [Seminavis robusta]|eukprot:Sro802_g204700.1 n/a (110) ;mRNA; f:37630-37959